MKKKIMVIVLAIVCSLALAMSLTACGDKNSDLPAHTHSYAWTDNGDGTHNGHCSVSGCDKPDINNESHVWGSDDKCEKCKAEKPKGGHEHTYSDEWTSAGADGHYHLANCGHTGEHTKIVPHVYDNAEDTTCNDCGYMRSVDPAHTHNLTSTSATEPDCTNNGNIAYWHCSDCKKYFADGNGNTEIALDDTVRTKLGHDWETEWTVDVEATTEHAGSKSHHCSRCDEKTDVTEIPRLTATTYNVIFNANGGKIDGKDTKTVTGTVNQKISKPSNDPVRPDYTFKGWYKDGTITALWNFDTDVITGATTLYAGWEQNITEYDVTFVLNYPSASNTTKTTENGLITYIPTRTGYIFNGWWYSDGQTSDGSYILSEKFDTSKKVTQSGLKLYAEWVAQRTDDSQLYSPSVSISEDGVFTWNAIDGAQGYKVEVYSGTNKVTEQSLTTTSWTFPNSMTAGYYTVKVRANGDGETTVNSAWTEKYYSHHMLGWVDWRFNNATSIMPWDAVKNATAYEIRIDGTLKATITYTTYDLSDLEAGSYNVTVTPTRDGWVSITQTEYTLTKKRLKTPNVTVTENSSDCTYTLSWQAVAHADTYRIKHHDTYIAVTGTTYTIDNDSAIYGANGIGEFTVCAYDSNTDYFISNDSNSETVKKMYLVTLNKSDNGAGTVSPSDGHKVGESVTVSASTNNGYTWLGWYDGNTKLTDNLSYTFTMPSENKTFTAKWALYTLTVNCGEGGTVTRDYGVSSYTVSFDLNGATGTPPQQQIITTTNGLTYPDILVRSGYLFGGWYENADCSGLPFDFSQGVEADVRLYAKWVGYSAEGVLDSAETVAVLNGDYYAFVPLKSGEITVGNSNNSSVSCEICNAEKRCIYFVSNKTGKFTATAGELYYLFVKSTSGASAITTLSVSNTTPTAGGKASFPVNGGVAVGTSVKLVAETNAGYTWVGWYNGDTKLTNELNYMFTMPSENKTYAAKWCKITVSSSDSSAGSVTSLTGTYKSGDSATVTATTNSGYTWLGWYDGDTKLTDDLSYTFTMPSENKTYAAKWKVNDGLGNFTFTSTPTTLTITGVKDKTVTELVVPDCVTEIEQSAFSGCNNLTIITIPFVGASKDGRSNTYFGYIFGASSYSSNSSSVPSSLKTVVITGGTSIGSEAFYDCSGLTSITIPDSVTSIGRQAFSNCSGLTSITIPDGVTSIGEETFYGCSSLTIYCEATSKPSDWNSSWNYSSCPIVWDCNNNDKDGNGYAYAVIDGIRYSLKDGIATVVRQLSNISGAIVIPASVTYKGANYSVTSIGSSAFYYCSKLTSITIPDSVTSIGGRAFSGCSCLTSITIPFIGASNDGTSNTHFGYIFGASSYSSNSSSVPTSLKTVIITGGTSIGNSAFYHCSSLTSITILNSVTSIGEYAFRGCSSLTSITILNSVTSIGEEAFVGCSKLQYNEYENAYYLGNDTNKYVALIKVKNQSITSCTIHQNTKVIADYAFYYCKSLTSITIPTGVTSIGSSAFWDCSSLTSITIPDSVTSIGDGAFSNCSGLTSITIPDGVTSIGSSAFYYCSKLTSITIPDSVTSIGRQAFEYCSGLTSITIPTGVTSIGSRAFWDCSSLTSITIPDSVTSIGEGAFSGCSGLTSITFKGTRAQWNAISKGNGWNSNTGNYTVKCTDGNISKNNS